MAQTIYVVVVQEKTCLNIVYLEDNKFSSEKSWTSGLIVMTQQCLNDAAIFASV